MKLFKKLSAVAVLGLLGACATNNEVSGVLFSSYKMAKDTNPQFKSAKVGQACFTNIDIWPLSALLFGANIGLSFGDGSVSTAMTNGGVTKVATVDHEVFSVLGVYGKVCTNVAGE
jgi:hypothetical protein